MHIINHIPSLMILCGRSRNLSKTGLLGWTMTATSRFGTENVILGLRFVLKGASGRESDGCKDGAGCGRRLAPKGITKNEPQTRNILHLTLRSYGLDSAVTPPSKSFATPSASLTPIAAANYPRTKLWMHFTKPASSSALSSSDTSCSGKQQPRGNFAFTE